MPSGLLLFLLSAMMAATHVAATPVLTGEDHDIVIRCDDAQCRKISLEEAQKDYVADESKVTVYEKHEDLPDFEKDCVFDEEMQAFLCGDCTDMAAVACRVFFKAGEATECDEEEFKLEKRMFGASSGLFGSRSSGAVDGYGCSEWYEPTLHSEESVYGHDQRISDIIEGPGIVFPRRSEGFPSSALYMKVDDASEVSKTIGEKFGFNFRGYQYARHGRAMAVGCDADRYCTYVLNPIFRRYYGTVKKIRMNDMTYNRRQIWSKEFRVDSLTVRNGLIDGDYGVVQHKSYPIPFKIGNGWHRR